MIIEIVDRESQEPICVIRTKYRIDYIYDLLSNKLYNNYSYCEDVFISHNEEEYLKCTKFEKVLGLDKIHTI